MVYQPLLPLMRTPRLPVVDWTDSPADLNGLVRFAERRNLVSARVPSHFKRSLLQMWAWILISELRTPSPQYTKFLTAKLKILSHHVFESYKDFIPNRRIKLHLLIEVHLRSIWTVPPQEFLSAFLTATCLVLLRLPTTTMYIVTSIWIN